MILSHPLFENPITVGGDGVPSVVLESPRIKRELISELMGQINGKPGNWSVFPDNHLSKPDSIAKRIVLVFDFFDEDALYRPLNTKLVAKLIEAANDATNHENTSKILSDWECYILSLGDGLSISFDCEKIDPSSLIKAAGTRVSNDAETLPETLLNLFEIYRELDFEKLFILVNVRDYIEDREMELFLQDIVNHQYQVLLVESVSKGLLKAEKRTIIDEDLCLIF